MRGLVFNLLNERLRQSRRGDGWDWLFDDDGEECGDIQVDLESVVMPLVDAPRFVETQYWPSLTPRPRKLPN